jgi:hypothetical protein
LTGSTEALLFIFMTAGIALNVGAIVCLLRSDAYTPAQKTLQAILVWLVPLIGAVWVLSVWFHDRKSPASDPVRHAEGPWLPGIGPENDSVHHGDSFGGSSHDGHGGEGGGSGD